MKTDYASISRNNHRLAHNRHSTLACIETKHQAIDCITGIIQDLSPFGGRLLLAASKELLQDKLTLVISDKRIASQIKLDCRILWQCRNSIHHRLEIGCEFLRPGDSTKLALMQLIRTFREKQRQLIVRCEMY